MQDSVQIEAKKLNFIYGEGSAFEQYAIKDVSFTIKKGEFVGVIGHTGSGKSTLIQHLNGLIKATSGELFFNGENIYTAKYDMKLLRQKVGLVFQYPEHQLFEVDVLSDVEFGPRNQKLSEEVVEARAKESLALVGLDESYYKKSPFELSGGQKRRVAIAGVLAMNPEVLILDEPTAGLDPKGRDELFDEIMNAGELVLDGTPKDVFKKYKYLESIGLSAPGITYIVERLKKEGIDLGDDITTIEEARDTILEYIKRKDKNA